METLELHRHTTILKNHFLLRKETNPRFSLRSFAHYLGIPSSNLSMVLNGKRGLSRLSAQKIADRLKMSMQEKDEFINSVMQSHARSKKEKILAKDALKSSQLNSGSYITDDYFCLISDWYYFAILELLVCKDFCMDIKTMAKKLLLTESEVSQALKRLERLELIKKKKGQYIPTQILLKTRSDIPSMATKKHNIQLLNKQINAILNDQLSEREIRTLTVACHEEDIAFVKEQVRKFTAEINVELTNRLKTRKANRVYALTVGFFNLLTKE